MVCLELAPVRIQMGPTSKPTIFRIPRTSLSPTQLRHRTYLRIRAFHAPHKKMPLLRLGRKFGMHDRGLAPTSRRKITGLSSKYRK